MKTHFKKQFLLRVCKLHEQGNSAHLLKPDTTLVSPTLYLLDNSSSRDLGMVRLVGNVLGYITVCPPFLRPSGSFSYRLYDTACTSFKAQLKGNHLREIFIDISGLPLKDFGCDLHVRTSRSTRKYFLGICLSIWT